MPISTTWTPSSARSPVVSAATTGSSRQSSSQRGMSPVLRESSESFERLCGARNGPIELPAELALCLSITHLARPGLALVRAPAQGRLFLAVWGAEFVRLELADFVSEATGFLELQVGRGVAHL